MFFLANEKNDRRVKYTKMVLRQSLLELMKTSSVNKITVKDICSLADINRGTFYAHYKDPYDLLQQIENDLFLQLHSTLQKSSSYKPDGEYFLSPTLVTEIFEAIRENSDICKVLFSKNGDAEFLKKVLYIAHDRCMTEWAKNIIKKPEVLEYLYSFIANGSAGIIQNWVESGMEEKPQDIAAIVDRMAYSGITGFMSAE